MKDKSLTQHYQQILGDTSPWDVSEVRLDVAQLVNEVRLTVRPEAIWACPQCQARMHVKEWRTRRWRHLDSCQFKTVLETAVPVVECSKHGAQTVQVPWAEGSSRFTMCFESFAVHVLEACSAARAGKLLGISWDEADGIKQRAVRRGLARRQLNDLEYVCVDEKAVGHGHDYVTVVTGVMAGKPQVLYVGDGRGEEGLNGFWEMLGPEGCGRIQAVSMDMGQPYQNSTRRYCPNAELIFDPFHIMKMLNKAVDEVRRREAVMGTGLERASLKKTRQLWLWGEENVPLQHAARFEDLKQSTLKTARAWGLKELWRTFKCCVDADDAAAFFKKWYALAIKSKLEPIKRVARSLKEHLDGIVSIFKYGFCNALAEGVNSRIQLLVQKACGYRNRARLKIDILFHFGGLNLNPLSDQ
ncbi:MAG: ISL3 family transposase [Dehalococcoidia bacterium]